MRAGYAVVDITPPVGIELAGFIARRNPSTGVHDRLLARALVFEDDGARAAVVACDLIGLGRNLVRRVRARVAERTGIPAAAQLFACTHTHGGPETGGLATIAQPDPRYLLDLEDRLAEAVVAAAGSLRPALLGYASGESRVAENRVYGRLGREGPADPTLAVVRVAGESGEPIATVVNYACHATVAGAETRLINADFPGCLVRALEGAGVGPALFVNGAGADCRAAGGDTRGHEVAEQVGRRLAEDVVPIWRAIAPAPWRGIAAAVREVELPLQPVPGPEEAAELLRAGRERLAGLPPDSWERRALAVTHVRYGTVLAQLHFGRDDLPRVTAEAQAIRVGGITFVGLPGESFSALGRAARAACSGPAVVAGWANDVVGYLPDRASYAVGGYEFDTAHRYYGLPAAFAPEAGERLVEAARDLARLVA